MKIAITGASGFIGRILADHLWTRRHHLVLLSRKPPRSSNLTQQKWIAWNPGAPGDWEQAIEGVDGIINLAGEPIAAKRWSDLQKEKIRSSRIESTKALVRAIAKAKQKPKFLISSSAVGYYGARGDETVTEETAPGHDYLSRVCVDWEREASNAESYDVRVVLVRTGIVLDKGKGALAKMVVPFKCFVGGPLGSGNQWMPWIHIEDQIALLLFLLENQSARGPFNATAPNPVTMTEFCKTLGTVLNRPSWASVPGSMLTLLVGEMAEMLLNGQRAVPQAAMKLGYEFKYPYLLPALESLHLR
ncbi:MAG TPA: TIGR01777 family oxidoreductase [Candidatus Binatia bacterium]|nr:TIGR01777 family oxidoreductase [Candidatus Binatia bacterium]